MCFIAVAFSGCASIIKGRTKNVNVMTSTGDEAQAKIFTSNGMQEVILPQVISMKKDSQDLTITIKENRCTRSSTFMSSSKIEPWFWGNILTGGVFGSTTDASTGAMWTYDDNIIVPVYQKDGCK